MSFFWTLQRPRKALPSLFEDCGRALEAWQPPKLPDPARSGDLDGDASSRWAHKGVSGIPYDSKNDHVALWETLKEWSERAKDPEGWRAKTLELAQRGPENLSLFQREQVAHLVSTKEGARTFLESDPPAPATWLCVFDSSIRYSQPDTIHSGEDQGKVIDPFSS